MAERTVAVAVAGGGALAHNAAAICAGAGLRVVCHIDEFADGPLNGVPVHRAADLGAGLLDEIDVVLIAMSAPEHRAAAVARLDDAGVEPASIITVDADESLLALSLALRRGGQDAARFLASSACRSQHDLEAHVFGERWRAVLLEQPPAPRTVALCLYGRGGGFRSHLEWLIPHLRDRSRIVCLADEEVPGDEIAGVPVLYMSPASACRFREADLYITAHFIPCSPPDRPRVSLLHTSFDFILEEEWIVDRLATADPHYVVSSTRATHDWMTYLAAKAPAPHRLAVIPGGYPRLDAATRKADAHQRPATAILYAPTLSLNAVRDHHLTYSMPRAPEILRRLRADHPDRRVIFRPHPNDLRSVLDGRDDVMAAPLRAALALCESDPGIELDGASPHETTSHAEAAVMVSDTSSTAYTFALSTLRPVVFFSPCDDEVRAREGERSSFIRDRERVGAIAQSIGELSHTVGTMLAEPDLWHRRIADYRAETCFHPGRSETEIVAAIETILSGGVAHDEWHWSEAA